MKCKQCEGSGRIFSIRGDRFCIQCLGKGRLNVDDTVEDRFDALIEIFESVQYDVLVLKEKVDFLQVDMNAIEEMG